VLSLADIEKMGMVEHITMHHCLQGWSGIAKWGGIPTKSLIDLFHPKPEAKTVVSFPSVRHRTVVHTATPRDWRMY